MSVLSVFVQLKLSDNLAFSILGLFFKEIRNDPRRQNKLYNKLITNVANIILCWIWSSKYRLDETSLRTVIPLREILGNENVRVRYYQDFLKPQGPNQKTKAQDDKQRNESTTSGTIVINSNSRGINEWPSVHKPQSSFFSHSNK